MLSTLANLNERFCLSICATDYDADDVNKSVVQTATLWRIAVVAADAVATATLHINKA